MLKVLVTGANGQLGSEIRSLAPGIKDMAFIFTDIEELDITDARAVEDFFMIHQPDILINCAAYTAVDKAETEPEKAFQINASAVAYLVVSAANHGCYPVHISTDYVFSGNLHRPYSEEDTPDPASAYGRSKLEGEKAFWKNSPNGLILRTSWLYSSYGNNFVKTILKAGKEKGELRVVSDQIGNPTYARDLAGHLLQVIPDAINKNKSGVYHYSNEGICSWFDLAVTALELAGIPCKVTRIRTSEYPTPVKRPAYSVLDKSKIKKEFGIELPEWKESLRHCLQAMRV